MCLVTVKKPCSGKILCAAVKWSHYRPGVNQRLGRSIALLFHDCCTRRAWVVSSTPQLHFTPRKDPVPIFQEAGWAPGPVWTGKKSRPHRDSIPDRPACSQSLYWLSYPQDGTSVLTKFIYSFLAILSTLRSVLLAGTKFSLKLLNLCESSYSYLYKNSQFSNKYRWYTVCYGIWILVGERGFCVLQNVWTSSALHPASSLVDSGVNSRG